VKKRKISKPIMSIAIFGTVIGIIIIAITYFFSETLPYRDIVLVVGGSLFGFITLGFGEYFDGSVERAKTEIERIEAERERIETKTQALELNKKVTEIETLNKTIENLNQEIKRIATYPIEQKQRDVSILAFFLEDFGNEHKGGFDPKTNDDKLCFQAFDFTVKGVCIRLGIPAQLTDEFLTSYRNWRLGEKESSTILF
jgi:hypothetical protein